MVYHYRKNHQRIYIHVGYSLATRAHEMHLHEVHFMRDMQCVYNSLRVSVWYMCTFHVSALQHVHKVHGTCVHFI